MRQTREDIAKRLGVNPLFVMCLNDDKDWENIKSDYADISEVIWQGVEEFYGFPIRTDADFEKALELVPPAVITQYLTKKSAVIMNYVNCKYFTEKIESTLLHIQV